MEVGEQQVLAWRATGCFAAGDTPFYDLCLFGSGLDAIRGYIGGQYRDESSLTTQLEYRRPVYKRWGMVAFGGIGQVAPSLSELNADNILPSAGLGIRFRASEKDQINLSVDYARGKDSDAWYFRIGEAF
jgi:outer membrane translocation and assembly module TamA